MKKFTLLLVAMLLFYSCSKDEHRLHLGKWKLMSVYFNPMKQIQNLDFSKVNIFFEFKRNGVLEISDDIGPHIDPNWTAKYGELYLTHVIVKGTYDYFIEYDNNPNNPWGGYLIKFGEQTYNLVKFNKIKDGLRMNLGRFGSGGPSLEVVKVKR